MRDDTQGEKRTALAEAVEATPAIEGAAGLQNIGDMPNAPGVEELTSARVIEELAHLTETVERQGTDQQRILVDIFRQLRGGGGPDNSAPKNPQKGKKGKLSTEQPTPISGIETKEVISGTEKGKTEPKRTSNSRPKLSESTPVRDITVNEVISGDEKGKQAPKRERRVTPVEEPVTAPTARKTASEARARRTVTLGDTPPAPTVAEPVTAVSDAAAVTEAVSQPAEPTTPVPPTPARTSADSPPENSSRADGFYLGDDGRVRRPDGRFANRVEVRRFNRDTGSSSGEGDNAAGDSSLLKKAVGMLGGKGSHSLAETDAADTAGVAAGSSFWMAAKEVKGMADEVKDALNEREITSAKGAKAYAKDKAEKLWGVIKKPFGAKADIETATPPPATTTVANPDPGPGPVNDVGIGERKNQEQTENARADAIRRKEQAQTQEQHAEVLDRLDALIDASKNRQRGLAGEKLKSWLDGRGGKEERRGRKGRKGRGKGPFSRSAGADPDARRRGRQTGADRTRTTRPGIERTTSAGDLPDLSSSRREPGRTGRPGSAPDRPSARRETVRAGRRGRMPRLGAVTEGLSTVTSRGTETLARAAKTGPIARVAAAIPRVGAPLASVASMSGVTGGVLNTAVNTATTAGKGAAAAGKGVLSAGKGVLSAGKGALEVGGRGALAMGGRAIPLIGAAMTAYDAYTGFNDEEAQRRTFGIKDDTAPNTGQKTAMAAGQVLDMGGLTSGLSGLLASGAGALGMTNLQQSLTFDSDDIARKVYDAFSNDKSMARMGVKEGDSGTALQKITSGVATAANLGGIVSGTASLLGGIAEDLGFDGAKKALTFDTSDLAESLYDFFGPLLGDKNTGQNGPVTINMSTARYETASARQSITEADVKQAGKQYDFSEVEQANGLPSGFMNAMAAVESGGNPLAYNKSGAAGMFQLMPTTAKSLGVTDPYDVKQSANAAAKLATDNARYFTKQTGRVPEGRELYLLHQQGMGGGTALAQNPTMSAVDALTKGGQKNAAQAILQNGGTLNMTAQQFADMIMAKYDKNFTAQSMAREQGAKPVPLEKATETAVSKSVEDAPNMLLRKPAADVASTGAAAAPAAVPPAVAVPLKDATAAGVTDIQKEEARAEQLNPGATELTAKMDPRLTDVMVKLDRTLNGMKPAQGNTTNTTNNTTNTTNNYHGQSRSVGDHDSVSWPGGGK